MVGVSLHVSPGLFCVKLATRAASGQRVPVYHRKGDVTPCDLLPARGCDVVTDVSARVRD